MRRTIIAAIGALVLAGGAAGATRDTKLSLVAYSTPGAAFAKIIPAFQKTPAGKDISFEQSYGASEVQAKAVIAGLPADIVDLSLEPDMQRLVSAGFVAKSWKQNATTASSPGPSSSSSSATAIPRRSRPGTTS